MELSKSESFQEDLELKMSNFQIQREGYEGTVTPSDSTLLKLAVVVALQRVGEEILHKRAVLLTTVFSEFLNTMCTDTCTPALRESLTARWLLGKIARKLSPHLAFSCSCRKIGTVLYRSGGDLIYSLSLALSNVQSHWRGGGRIMGYMEMTVPVVSLRIP